MKIFGRSNDPRPWTNPFPERDTRDGIPGTDGFLWALRGGDLVSPVGLTGSFFGPPPPAITRRWISRAVLPFFAARRGRFGFYVGWKAYGFDSPAYLKWPSITPADVFEGSIALQGFTMRFSGSLAVLS